MKKILTFLLVKQFVIKFKIWNSEIFRIDTIIPIFCNILTEHGKNNKLAMWVSSTVRNDNEISPWSYKILISHHGHMLMTFFFIRDVIHESEGYSIPKKTGWTIIFVCRREKRHCCKAARRACWTFDRSSPSPSSSPTSQSERVWSAESGLDGSG